VRSFIGAYINKKFMCGRKKLAAAGLGIGMFFLLGTGVFLFLLSPPHHVPAGEIREIAIAPETPLREIARQLYDAGLIRSPYFFRLYLRLTDRDRQLKAGNYRLVTGVSVPVLTERLCAGENSYIAVTIPEGFTMEQIAGTLQQKGLIDADKFWEAAEKEEFAYDFLNEAVPARNRLEGFLFPDTYYISRGMSEKDIIEMMLKRFAQVLTPEVRERLAEENLTVQEMVTLASMVEKEARHPEEQPLIAGVMLNRLQAGMPLQVDATVLYALGEHRERVYYRDLEVDSPYNTYRYRGLPPGPIASPGEGAIRAVLYPASHNYLYYVARPDGFHIFSATLEEHNRARRLVREMS